MEIINTAPVPRPTILGSYGYGWQQLWKHFLYFFLVALLVGLLESPSFLGHDPDMDGTPTPFFLQLLSVAYMFLIFPVINYGGDLLYLRGIRNENMDITVLFQGFKKNYLNIVLAHLLLFAILGIGFVLFIIPGIIFACRLAFVSFLVMDKDLEPIAAIEKSWEMTRGHGWKIFGMGLLAIPIFILGLLCFLVGAFIAVMWIGAAFTAMYHVLDMDGQETLDVPADNWQEE